MDKIIILGAGLAGISTSFHIGHDRCRIFERNHYPGGHIHTEFADGFTWDEGPHISFTKHSYVRELFEENVDGKYLEYPVATGNHFQGYWIPHPAQVNLYAVPEPLRTRCLEDFLEIRKDTADYTPVDYAEWLRYAFGETFAKTFPSAYTRKYWTTDASSLTTDWVGQRVFFPSIEDVRRGADAPLPMQTHYIKAIRYPVKGGYMAFAQKMVKGANIDFHYELAHISFGKRILVFSNGSQVPFNRLVSTLPLPSLIQKSDAPVDIQVAAAQLSCSSLLLVNVTADHPTARAENWIYVYDEDQYATRINCTELLSPNNAPPNKTGIQVEVYFSKYRPVTESHERIASKVCAELVKMGLVRSDASIESVHTRWVPWANVIFDHERKAALDRILDWLERQGLAREEDDLDPMTDWEAKLGHSIPSRKQSLFLAGRYAQWKYYWTDDCVLQGLYLSKLLSA